MDRVVFIPRHLPRLMIYTMKYPSSPPVSTQLVAKGNIPNDLCGQNCDSSAKRDHERGRNTSNHLNVEEDVGFY
jgi:hypothetical protein